LRGVESRVESALKLKYDKRLSSFAFNQGLTLVHLSAQRQRFLWDRWCVQGLLRGCSGGCMQY
jgi:hypothetical protein